MRYAVKTAYTYDESCDVCGIDIPANKTHVRVIDTCTFKDQTLLTILEEITVCTLKCARLFYSPCTISTHIVGELIVRIEELENELEQARLASILVP